jgi:NTP pyrophosphatase (non-canonical NTP hydrolase)
VPIEDPITPSTGPTPDGRTLDAKIATKLDLLAEITGELASRKAALTQLVDEHAEQRRKKTALAEELAALAASVAEHQQTLTEVRLEKLRRSKSRRTKIVCVDVGRNSLVVLFIRSCGTRNVQGLARLPSR